MKKCTDKRVGIHRGHTIWRDRSCYLYSDTAGIYRTRISLSGFKKLIDSAEKYNPRRRRSTRKSYKKYGSRRKSSRRIRKSRRGRR